MIFINQNIVKNGSLAKLKAKVVTFMGCPLHCKYCLNRFCHESVFYEEVVTTRKDVALISRQEFSASGWEIKALSPMRI